MFARIGRGCVKIVKAWSTQACISRRYQQDQARRWAKVTEEDMSRTLEYMEWYAEKTARDTEELLSFMGMLK